MVNRLCYLSHNYRELNSSGNKAKHDNETTLCEMGAVNLGMPTSYHHSKIAAFFLNLAGVCRLALHVRKGDVVVLQYPVKKYFSTICRMAHLRGAKVMALIHDLGSMRRKKLSVTTEINRLMGADYVIATNSTMQAWLKEKGYRKGMGALQLHDYRSATIAPLRSANHAEPLPRVVYAGALAPRKNMFLLQMQEAATHFQLEIYGNRNGIPGLSESENVHIHDFMAADDFIKNVQGEYGLVWDGDSLDECTGNFGEYLRWNTPHKASFYLRAGLPIIVWRESALALVVQQYGIGLCVDSIRQLNTTLAAISPEEWNEMQQRVRSIEQRMQQGDFFRTALQTGLQQLEHQ